MPIEQHTITAFLDELAAKSPTPGGGAVAGLTAAVAAALGRMVVNYSVGKKSLALFSDLHHRSLEQLESCGRKALALAEADAVAYAHLTALWKLDKDDPKRRAGFPGAVQAAIDAPLAVLALALDMLHGLHELVGTTNQQLASDLAIAAILADSSARAAGWNVRVNLPQLEDVARRDALEEDVTRQLTASRTLSDKIDSSCRTH